MAVPQLHAVAVETAEFEPCSVLQRCRCAPCCAGVTNMHVLHKWDQVSRRRPHSRRQWQGRFLSITASNMPSFLLAFQQKLHRVVIQPAAVYAA